METRQLIEPPAAFYHALLDQLVDGVYVVDPARRIVFWSAGAERITGYTAEEVVGRCCADNILMHVDCHRKMLVPMWLSLGDVHRPR